MMTQVLVTGIDGNEIRCSDGVTRNAIGNSQVCVGDVLWSNGDYVFSPGQPASRAPIVWAESGYRFADAATLKMYYVDKKFKKITRTKGITPPVAGATLLLHCYNAKAEYLLWDVAADLTRIILQKGSATIADFSPQIESTYLNEIDGEIDSSGDLLWGVYYDYDEGEYPYQKTYSVSRTYRNATISATTIICREDAEGAAVQRAKDRSAAISFSWSVGQIRQETMLDRVYYAGYAYTGSIYEADFTGCTLSTESWATYGSGNISTPIALTLAHELYVPEYGYAGQHIQTHISGWSYDPEDSTVTDESYDGGGLSTQITCTEVFRQSDRARVASLSEHTWPEDTVKGVTYGYRVTLTSDVVLEPHTISPNYRPDGRLYFSLSREDGEYEGSTASFTGQEGENAGVTRVGTGEELFGSNNNRWPTKPRSGERFTVLLYRGVQHSDYQSCEVHITSSYAITNTTAAPVTTPVGDGYGVGKQIAIGNAYGYAYETGVITNGGDVAYSFPDHSTAGGAWSAQGGELVGVATATGTGIKVEDATAVEITIPDEIKTTVTTRFA